MSTYVLGISGYYHDSAACLVKDGVIVAATQEERFTRKKHDPSFPKHAVAYCLKEVGITAKDLQYVSFYEKPVVKFDRILQTLIYFAPRSFASYMKALPVWLGSRLWLLKDLKKELPGFSGEFVFPTHHEAHASSAFFASPFDSSAILTIDAVGEWNTTTYGTGKGNKISLVKTIDFPHSLGMLYSAFTYYCGFKVNSGEYKLMGLAPYGKPAYADKIKEHLIDIKEDGSFRLDMNYFGYGSGLTMTNKKFEELFGKAPRKAEDKMEQFHMDMASSIQVVTEEIVLAMARHIRKETGENNLVLAGGVALNCVANGHLLREKTFDNVWIQPASGDAGGALGSALFVWYQYLNNKREVRGKDAMSGAYLGPAFSNEEIEKVLNKENATYTKLSEDELVRETARLLSEGNVVGWYQGRMEYGPRALGNRSIIGDPRNREMQSTMNLKIKFRESFRPFAPSVLEEKVGEYFEGGAKSPYMLLTFPVESSHRKEKRSGVFGFEQLKELLSDVPAITHVDYSARVQSVSRDTNPLYHKLISEFERQTGCPLVVNTSFNVRGEPIVCTPHDAWKCFSNTHMDYLVMGNYLVSRTDKPDVSWANQFELD